MTAALVDALLPLLPRPSRGDHARGIDDFLRPGARPTAAVAVRYAQLRHSLFPARPRLSCRERQAGGGSPAPGQDASRASRSAPSSSTWCAASAGTGRAPGSPSGETATTAGPMVPWRGARRTASTTSSAWRAIPCCTASHTASPTTSLGAPRRGRRRKDAELRRLRLRRRSSWNRERRVVARL